MADCVLVGGAWLGGWCWKVVARRLRESGHDAYPVTLTGLGDREHLASPEVDLQTHVADLIEYEDLRDVVLLEPAAKQLDLLPFVGRFDAPPVRSARLAPRPSSPWESKDAITSLPRPGYIPLYISHITTKFPTSGAC